MAKIRDAGFCSSFTFVTLLSQFAQLYDLRSDKDKGLERRIVVFYATHPHGIFLGLQTPDKLIVVLLCST